MSDTPDILTCTDLAIGHGKTVIMDHLNLSLEPGKILAIVGPSGCGKSTLMRALGGLDEPLGGKTTLMGVDLAAAHGQEREDILPEPDNWHVPDLFCCLKVNFRFRHL